MQLTLSRKEIERICVDRFKLLDEVSTGATINCHWLDSNELEIIIEPLHVHDYQYEVLK